MSCELKLYGMFINNYVFPPNKTSGESLDEAKFMECLLNNYDISTKQDVWRVSIDEAMVTGL